MERQLIVDYVATIEDLLGKLDRGNVDLAAEIASIPEHIRGYGHVKEAHLHKAQGARSRAAGAVAQPAAHRARRLASCCSTRCARDAAVLAGAHGASGAVLFHGVGRLIGLLGMVLGRDVVADGLQAGQRGPDRGRLRAAKAMPATRLFAGDAMAVRQIFLGLALLVLGWLRRDRWRGRSGLSLYCVALALLLPAMVILLVMEDSLLRAFDPRLLVRAAAPRRRRLPRAGAAS